MGIPGIRHLMSHQGRQNEDRASEGRMRKLTLLPSTVARCKYYLEYPHNEHKAD
jgi:hypothetical protein